MKNHNNNINNIYIYQYVYLIIYSGNPPEQGPEVSNHDGGQKNISWHNDHT